MTPGKVVLALIAIALALVVIVNVVHWIGETIADYLEEERWREPEARKWAPTPDPIPFMESMLEAVVWARLQGLVVMPGVYGVLLTEDGFVLNGQSQAVDPFGAWLLRHQPAIHRDLERGDFYYIFEEVFGVPARYIPGDQRSCIAAFESGVVAGYSPERGENDPTPTSLQDPVWYGMGLDMARVLLEGPYRETQHESLSDSEYDGSLESPFT